MKKTLLFLAVIAVVIGAVGCGKSDDAGAAAPKAGDAKAGGTKDAAGG